MTTPPLFEILGHKFVVQLVEEDVDATASIICPVVEVSAAGVGASAGVAAPTVARQT